MKLTKKKMKKKNKLVRRTTLQYIYFLKKFRKKSKNKKRLLRRISTL